MAPTIAEIFRRLRHHLNTGLVKHAAKTFLIIEVTIRFRQICLYSNSIFLFRMPLGVHRVFVIVLMFEITQTGIELSVKKKWRIMGTSCFLKRKLNNGGLGFLFIFIFTFLNGGTSVPTTLCTH